MKTLQQQPGTLWFVDIAILPFLRRVEYRDRWFPRLGLVFGLSLAPLILDGLSPGHLVPSQWITIGLMVIAVISAILMLVLMSRFPVHRKERALYRTVENRGVILDQDFLHLTLQNDENRHIAWKDITGWYVKILESSANMGILTLQLDDRDVSFPFLSLTRADRIPIPGMLEDGTTLYYCYRAGERVPFTAENNDLYEELLKRIPDRHRETRLERLKFKCPHCDELFALKIGEWRRQRLNVLYCNQCPRCITVSRDDKRYKHLLDTVAGEEGVETVIGQEGNVVTFRGLTGSEPPEYSFEILQGNTADLPRRDRRDERFRESLEELLNPCSCGGTYRFSCLPRCPLCSRELSELVIGLGYGRYALIRDNDGETTIWKETA